MLVHKKQEGKQCKGNAPNVQHIKTKQLFKQTSCGVKRSYKDIKN